MSKGKKEQAFYNKLTKYLKANKEVSVTRLAEMSGVSPATLYNVLSGKTSPGINIVDKVESVIDN